MNLDHLIDTLSPFASSAMNALASIPYSEFVATAGLIFAAASMVYARHGVKMARESEARRLSDEKPRFKVFRVSKASHPTSGKFRLVVHASNHGKNSPIVSGVKIVLDGQTRQIGIPNAYNQFPSKGYLPSAFPYGTNAGWSIDFDSEQKAQLMLTKDFQMVFDVEGHGEITAEGTQIHN